MKKRKLIYIVASAFAAMLFGSFGSAMSTTVQSKANVQATKIVATTPTKYWVKTNVSNKAYAYTAKLGKKLFKLKAHQKVVFTSTAQRKIKVNGHYRTYRYVKGDNLKGWVNSGYLTEAKINETTTTTPATGTTTTTGGASTATSTATVKTPVKDPNKTYTPDQGVSWPTTNITYAFIPGMSVTEKQLWYTAVQDWNSLGVVSLIESDDYSTANIKITNVDSRSSGADEDTVGISYITSSKDKNAAGFQTMKSATIGILPDQVMKFGFDYAYTQFIAVHEFGHALGLAHSTDKGDVMYPYEEDPATQKITTADLNTLQYLYNRQ